MEENLEIIEYLDSEGNEIQEISPLKSLYTEGDDITNQIISEQDPDKLDTLTKLFSLNQKKKQIARINKLSGLLDKVDNEVITRFETNPEIIEDRDLYRYWQTTSEIISGRSDEENSLPHVQINNQTNINVNASGLNRESRAKVLEVVNQLLQEARVDDEVVDVEVNKKED